VTAHGQKSSEFSPAMLQVPASMAAKTAGTSPHVTTEAILSSTAARSASPDLFDLLESRPVWSIEELEKVLTVSRKTLYKQAKRGSFPNFRIGSCVRVYSKG